MIDITKIFIGKLCSNNHRYEDTDNSVRYKKNNNCVECTKERRKRYQKKDHVLATQRTRAKRYYHGNRDDKLIKMAEYRKTPGFKKAQKKHKDANKDVLLPKKRAWAEANKDRVTAAWAAWYNENKEAVKVSRKVYREENINVIRIRQAEYRENNKEEIKEKLRVYRTTEAGRLSGLKSRIKRNALEKKCIHISYNLDDIKLLFELFDNECAYCGSDDKLTLDHVVPLAENGIDGIVNIVPACIRCNSSKWKREMVEWYKSKKWYDQYRLIRILEYLSLSYTDQNQ